MSKKVIIQRRLFAFASSVKSLFFLIGFVKEAGCEPNLRTTLDNIKKRMTATVNFMKYSSSGVDELNYHLDVIRASWGSTLKCIYLSLPTFLIRNV